MFEVSVRLDLPAIGGMTGGGMIGNCSIDLKSYSVFDDVLYYVFLPKLLEKVSQILEGLLPMSMSFSTYNTMKYLVEKSLMEYIATNYKDWMLDLLEFRNITIEELLTHPNPKVRDYADHRYRNSRIFKEFREQKIATLNILH